MSHPTTLTASTLAWLSRCERRLWLDRYGDRSLRVADSPTAARWATAGVVHEAALMASMLEPAQPVEVPDWPALVAETQARMRAGAAEIRQGGLEARWGGLRLVGRPDLLRRTPRPSQLGTWSYEPVEIKQHGAATPRDVLQLDLYRWLLAQVQGLTSEGELWLGADADGRPAAILRRGEPLAGLERQLRQAADLQPDAEPPIAFARHCAYCVWRSACEGAADARQDIALLAGLDRRTAAALRGDGYTTLDALAALPTSRLARYPYAGASRAAQLHAHAQALLGNAPYRKAALPPALPAPALFFDIESRPDTQEPWAFGWLDAVGTPGIAIVSPRHVTAHRTQATIADIPVVFVRDVAAGWGHIAAQVARVEGAILHWGRYEQECLARSGGQRAQAALRPRLADLHPELDRRYALPIARGAAQTTGSLKAVGAYLGHRWPDEVDWQLAWEQYGAWQAQVARTPFGAAPDAAHDAGLAPGLAYLRADLEALRHIWMWLRAQR